jgi:hypothetical protein
MNVPIPCVSVIKISHFMLCSQMNAILIAHIDTLLCAKFRRSSDEIESEYELPLLRIEG